MIGKTRPPKKTYPIRQCAKCGRDFEHKRQDYQGKYCSRICSDSTNKQPPAQPWIEKECPHCQKPFLCPPWNLTINHCSIKCSHREAAKTVVGRNHPLWKEKVEMSCEVCGAKRQVKPSLVKRFRACSRRCASILGKQAWPRISSIERKMAAAFAEIGLSPTPQHTVGQYIVDFAFIDHRLAIECDGSYWHGRKKQQAKDRQKDGYLHSVGWVVLRLSEVDINRGTSKLAEIVRDLLG